MKNTVICIVGPTASGKTKLGIELAKKIQGEVISADSMQIYKRLNIGTAKVTAEEAQGIPHHLIDICDIDENFSVADFKTMCYDKIVHIQNGCKIPIIVGGTGLYVSSVVNDMQFDEQIVDEEYRNNLYKLAKEYSNEYVHKMLEEVDRKSANEIHPNNLKRVVRALEIDKFSNKTKSEHMDNEINRIQNQDFKFDFKIYAIDYDRQKLYDRINQRVDIMIQNGLLDEAKMILDMNLQSDVTCMQAIGYKELFPYIKGEDTLKNCVDKLKQETRNYAKRQVTWFKNKLNCKMLDYNMSVDEMLEIIVTDIS